MRCGYFGVVRVILAVTICRGTRTKTRTRNEETRSGEGKWCESEATRRRRKGVETGGSFGGVFLHLGRVKRRRDYARYVTSSGEKKQTVSAVAPRGSLISTPHILAQVINRAVRTYRVELKYRLIEQQILETVILFVAA